MFRDWLFLNFIRLNGTGHYVLQNMTIADYYGALFLTLRGCKEVVMSVQAKEPQKWVVISVNLATYKLLGVWVKYIRGPQARDDNASTAYVFCADNGGRSTSFNTNMQRFTVKHGFPHVTATATQAVWRVAARLSGEQSVQGDVEEGLQPNSFMCEEGTLTLGANLLY